MRASEVIQFLEQHPDWEVLIWAKDPKGELCLCPISKLDWDCFWPGGPSVFDLEIDTSLETTDRIALWLDNEGPLEVEAGGFADA